MVAVVRFFFFPERRYVTLASSEEPQEPQLKTHCIYYYAEMMLPCESEKRRRNYGIVMEMKDKKSHSQIKEC